MCPPHTPPLPPLPSADEAAASLVLLSTNEHLRGSLSDKTKAVIAEKLVAAAQAVNDKALERAVVKAPEASALVEVEAGTRGDTFTYEKYKDGHECAGGETSKGYITFAQCQAACTAEANCKFIDFAKPGKGGLCSEADKFAPIKRQVKGDRSSLICKCWTVSHECKKFVTHDEYTVFKKVKKVVNKAKTMVAQAKAALAKAKAKVR